MENEAFMKDLADVLEMERTELRNDLELSSDVWDSLTVISTIALIDEHFDIAVDGGELAFCSSIANLLDTIQQRIEA